MKRFIGMIGLGVLAGVGVMVAGFRPPGKQAGAQNSVAATSRAALQSEEGNEAQVVDVLQTSGKVTFLRVNDVGGSFGGCPNCITAEVVFQFRNNNRFFGLRLVDEPSLPSHQGALDLLRDAFENDWTVVIDYLDDNLPNRTVFPVYFGRVVLTKP